MDVISTRNVEERLSATLAVLKGISADGGLFVPEYFPRVEMKDMIAAAGKGYAYLAGEILSLFFDAKKEDMLGLTQKAYASFDAPEVVPIRRLTANSYVMELSHGPTLAFKDMALQVLPRLISAGLEVHNYENDVLVLTATSGDTGKAALEGFKNVSRTAIVVFYPEEGVSPMQKLQMVTQEGRNTGVYAVRGNFDDTQTGVKELFADAAFNAEAARDGYVLSSANSINIGRLIPQVAYYIYAYTKLAIDNQIENGEPVNFCVPTGNFGNILAAYYARRMGVPVGKLICASNKNNVLTDFFRNGNYNARRTFYKTMSPSMDILISSNLERLLFEIAGRDDGAVQEWMKALREKGHYTIPESAQAEMRDVFYADFCSEAETAEAIKRTLDDFGYLMDPHTAVAQCVYRKYVERTADTTATVIASTANPYKFPQDVLQAINGKWMDDAFEAAQALQTLTDMEIPGRIRGLETKKVLHKGVVDKGDQAAAVRAFLGRG